MGINNFKAFPSPNHQDSNVWNGKDCTWGSAIPGIKTYLWPCFSPPMFCSSYLPLFQKKKKARKKTSVPAIISLHPPFTFHPFSLWHHISAAIHPFPSFFFFILCLHIPISYHHCCGTMTWQPQWSTTTPPRVTIGHHKKVETIPLW